MRKLDSGSKKKGAIFFEFSTSNQKSKTGLCSLPKCEGEKCNLIKQITGHAFDNTGTLQPAEKGKKMTCHSPFKDVITISQVH